MKRYKKLVGEELLFKVRSFGKLETDNQINKVIYQCGYYHNDISKEVVLEEKKFSIAFRNARMDERKNQKGNFKDKEDKSNYQSKEIENKKDSIKNKEIAYNSDEYFDEMDRKMDNLKYQASLNRKKHSKKELIFKSLFFGTIFGIPFSLFLGVSGEILFIIPILSLIIYFFISQND